MQTTTRDKIIDAANTLFYAEGVRAVSVDRVAEAAGITKKTLYYHFRSKDDLVAAYLQSRDQPNIRAFQRWFEEADGDLSVKIQAIFSKLTRNARRPTWLGCGFQRTTAELANMPGHPAMKIGAAHKKRFEQWLAEMIAAHSAAAEPHRLARRIVLLMDGAFAMMLLHRDPSYIEEAGAAAAEMLAAAIGK